MDDVTRKLSRTIWIGVGLLIVILCLSFGLSLYEKSREQRRQANKAAPVLSEVKDFTLTNQLGQVVTLADLRGHVWVADIIFTSCAGPCPEMTKHMKELQDALPGSSNAKIVTLTTDPETDTPSVMMKYSERFGADPKRWLFLTGEKKELMNLAVDSLKFVAVPVKPEERKDPNDLFVHTTTFMVVDKQGRMRQQAFQTTGEGVDFSKTQQEILALIRQLERER